MLGEGDDIAEMLGPCRSPVNWQSFFARACELPAESLPGETSSCAQLGDCPRAAVGIRIMVFQAIPVSIEAD